jgi:hypothetical protein
VRETIWRRTPDPAGCATVDRPRDDGEPADPDDGVCTSRGVGVDPPKSR